MVIAFNIGDKVQINSGLPVYSNSQYSSQEFNGKYGTVVYIRKRYQGDACAYNQYQIHVDGYNVPKSSSLEFMFDELSLQKKESMSLSKTKFLDTTLLIGDRVTITKYGSLVYQMDGYSSLEFREKNGTIVSTRKRYQGSPNAYTQYQVHIDGYPAPHPHTLGFLFNESSLEKNVYV
jgi:hypothetical protein